MIEGGTVHAVQERLRALMLESKAHVTDLLRVFDVDGARAAAHAHCLAAVRFSEIQRDSAPVRAPAVPSCRQSSSCLLQARS